MPIDHSLSLSYCQCLILSFKNYGPADQHEKWRYENLQHSCIDQELKKDSVNFFYLKLSVSFNQSVTK